MVKFQYSYNTHCVHLVCHMHSWGSMCKTVCWVKCIQFKDSTCIQSHVLGSVTEYSFFFLVEFIISPEAVCKRLYSSIYLILYLFHSGHHSSSLLCFFCFVSVATKEGSKRGLRNHETGQEAVVQGQGEDLSSLSHYLQNYFNLCFMVFRPRPLFAPVTTPPSRPVL